LLFLSRGKNDNVVVGNDGGACDWKGTVSVGLIITIFIILLANLPIYSTEPTSAGVGADYADADYCVDLNGLNIKVVFVKKNNDLKPILLNVPASLICKDYYSDTSVYFKFIEKSGKEYFTSEQKLKGGGVSFDFKRITMMDENGVISCKTIPIGRTIIVFGAGENVELPQTIQAVYPFESGPILFIESERKKEDILRFKNKIIDAAIKIKLKCSTIDLDTTLTTNFRARITGECECDSPVRGN